MSRMANTACVSRRLLQTVSQIPSTRTTSRHFPCYHPPPKEWIRTITSSSTRYMLDTPGVSFGKENDGVIAPYAEKANKRAKPRKQKTTDLAEPVASEDYEIGGFIDRSGQKTAKSFVPLEGKLQSSGDESVAAADGRRRNKTGKSRSDDNNTDDQQDSSGYEPGSPGIKMLTRRVTPQSPVIRKHRAGSVSEHQVGAVLVRKHGGYGISSRTETRSVRKVTSDSSSVRKHDIASVRKHRTGPSPKQNLDLMPSREHEWKARRDQKTTESPTSGRPLEKKKTEGAELWTVQKNALKEKFQEGWQPRKKLSPDAMEGIRGLHEQDPIKYSTELLASEFQMSPEAIRRILKSKWLSRQSPEKLQERRERWAQRHDRIWDAQAELGLRPPRTKDKEIEDPDKFEQDLERRRILGETLFG